MTDHNFSDQSAIGVLKNPGSFSADDIEAAATHLEVSINGGDQSTVDAIALQLLGIAEQCALKQKE